MATLVRKKVLRIPKWKFRPMWSWLGKNKDSISALSTAFQSVAIILGIFVVINEFVIKDRTAERARVDAVMEIFKVSSSANGKLHIGDLLFDVIGKTPSQVSDVIREEGTEEFYQATTQTIQTYTQLQVCLKSNACDSDTAKSLFCGEAFFDAFVAYKAIVRPDISSQPNYDTRLDNLFDFYLGCSADGLADIPGRWQERRSSGWDSKLEDVFMALDEKVRNSLEDSAQQQ